MHYAYVAIPDSEIPTAAEPVFQHLLATYASESNKTASVWAAVPDDPSQIEGEKWYRIRYRIDEEQR